VLLLLLLPLFKTVVAVLVVMAVGTAGIVLG
jgi:hypothetical protein